MNIDFTEILPKTIYKYRDFDSALHRRIITHQEIYYAKASEFLEPYDSRYTLDRDYIKNEYNRRVYYSKVFNIRDLYHPVINGYINLNPITDKLLDEVENRSREFYDQNYGVFSVSENYRNNHLWQIFGANKKGFCVGIDMNAIPLNEGIKGRVKYVDKGELPKSKVLNHDDLISTTMFFTEMITMLPVEFIEEREYRIGKLIFKPEDRFKIIPKESITTIIIGERMSLKKKDEIITLVKKYLPNTIIKKINYSKMGFSETIV